MPPWEETLVEAAHDFRIAGIGLDWCADLAVGKLSVRITFAVTQVFEKHSLLARRGCWAWRAGWQYAALGRLFGTGELVVRIDVFEQILELDLLL